VCGHIDCVLLYRLCTQFTIKSNEKANENEKTSKQQKINSLSLQITITMKMRSKQQQFVTDKECMEEAVRRLAMIATLRNSPHFPVEEQQERSHLSMFQSHQRHTYNPLQLEADDNGDNEGSVASRDPNPLTTPVRLKTVQSHGRFQDKGKSCNSLNKVDLCLQDIRMQI
jgi:hypothetical protein